MSESSNEPVPDVVIRKALQVLKIPLQDVPQTQSDVCDLTSFVADSEYSVITDWRDPVIEVLGSLERALLRQGIRMQVSDDEPVVITLTADQFAVRFQLPDLESSDHNLHEFVFALDSMLPPSVAIYSLAECDESDGYVYTVLPVATWDELKSLLGSHFRSVFAKHPGLQVKKLPSPKPAKPGVLKKFNWQKEFNHFRRQQPSDEVPVDRWLPVVEAMDPRCPTPIVRHARTPTCDYNQRIQSAFQLALNRSDGTGPMAVLTPSEFLERVAADVDARYSDPWLLDGHTNRLATLLYEHAFAMLVGTSYARLVAHYLPDKTAPLGTGDPTWAYFVFLALGCDDEAQRLGDLLMLPFAQIAERHPWEKNREAYCDLVVYLHTGQRGRNLAQVEPIMVLCESSAWDDPENIVKALQYHCHKRGESFTHRCRRWVWPAPLYALARRSKMQHQLPADNPFLNQWRDRSDIDWTSPLLCRLQEIDKTLSLTVGLNCPPPLPVPPVTVPARVDRIENGKAFGTTILQEASGYQFTVKGPLDSAKAPDIGELWNFRMDSTGSMYVAETHPDLGPIHYEKY